MKGGVAIYDLRYTRHRRDHWLSAISHRLFCFSVFAPVWLLFAASTYALPTRKSTNDIPELAPPLPEIPPTLWEQYGWTLWILIPLVLVLTALVTALWLRPRKPPVLLAPAAQIRAALTALQARPEDGATLSQISHVLRRYLVAAFWLHPGETTTAEFCATLAANTQVGPELPRVVGDFLRYCDERKFSPSHATPPINAASRALELIELVEARRQSLQAVTAATRA